MEDRELSNGAERSEGANSNARAPSAISEVEAAKALLRAARDERDEANHRIANSLTQVSVYLRAQCDEAAAEPGSAALRRAAIRVQAIAQVHRHINAPDEEDTTSLETYLARFMADLQTALDITCDTDCAPVRVSRDVATQIAIIVSELTINAVKHARPDGGDVRMALTARPEGEGLHLSFRDDGIGLSDETPDIPGSGLGTMVIARAVERIGASLTSHSDGGAVFTLRVPLSLVD